MNDWYVLMDNEQMGPYSPDTLQRLIEHGQLRPNMLVWEEGLDDWIPAVQTGFLQFPNERPPVLPRRSNHSKGDFLKQFTAILKTILPTGEEFRDKVLISSTFWAFLAIGVVPLLIVTVESLGVQITLFSLFFAMLWGALLKVLLLRESAFWLGGVGALFFTGLLGLFFHTLWFLQFESLHSLLNEGVMSSNHAIRFFSLLYFAFLEEAIKAIPILLAARFLMDKITYKQLIVIGLFSGLGFAAFENIDYSWSAVDRTLIAGSENGLEAAAITMVSSLINQMLRSVSLCFLHAIWAGISAYFIMAGKLANKSQWLYCVLGIACAGILHTLYNWLIGLQGTLAGGIAVVSLLFFYTYTLRFFENNNETRIPATHSKIGGI